MSTGPPKPRFPPAPGHGVSDFRTAQPPADAGPTLPPRLPVRPALIPSFEDPLSPEALAADAARKEEARRCIRRTARLLAVAFVVANALLLGGTVLIDGRSAREALAVLVLVGNPVALIVVGVWADRAMRRRRRQHGRRPS